MQANAPDISDGGSAETIYGKSLDLTEIDHIYSHSSTYLSPLAVCLRAYSAFTVTTPCVSHPLASV